LQSEVFLTERILRHSPGSKKIYVKGERAPAEYWAASITMATPLHHTLKLYETTPRTGRTLFRVTTPLKFTPICGVGGGGGRNSGLTSRPFMSQLFNYLTSHSTCSSILRMFSPWVDSFRKRTAEGPNWIALIKLTITTLFKWLII